MAYMNQERKATLTPGIKAVLNKHGIKGTLSTDGYSLTVTLKSGDIDLIGNLNINMTNHNAQWRGREGVAVSPYHFQNAYSGKSKAFLTELFAAMNVGNHDNSDIQSEYTDIGWYTHVNIGKWGKPYKHNVYVR